MPGLNTASVSMAVTPTVVSTLFSHYLNRKPLKQRPTAHLSYDEGLHLVRSFLEFASRHTVEELQAFTAQWVPHPQWVKVEDVTIPQVNIDSAAAHLEAQLGPDGVRQVGGRKWWQWRKPKSNLEAEWIEMRADANQRKRSGDPVKRVMMYIHGGAYFFGSVDEHRYQMQRHARKLKARVFAPRYRLSPQFPFPCGLHDCLAAYLYLLTVQDPSTIVLAGDSAGGGMALALLCVLRDQGIPLPSGGILISPWVDLTHSFPSVSGDAPMDYIPPYGFHHRPSRGWPPPNVDDISRLKEEVSEAKRKKDPTKKSEHTKSEDTERDESHEDTTGNEGYATQPDEFLSVNIDGETITIKDQIQMYATNLLLAHPLVSPVMQPTLGGLPPLLIMVGGGEILRDEQMYLAHKCANPAKYAPAPEHLTETGRELLNKYKPTDVQLQVWDDLCHVAPTLSFTRPAKYMYRSIAQFGAWALARAQHTGIEIIDDDDISVISSSATDEESNDNAAEHTNGTQKPNEALPENGISPDQVGKAGDPLPHFKNHMIRQRVTRHGVVLPLIPESEMPGCCMDPAKVGVIKEGPSRKWLAAKKQWDTKFAGTKEKVHKKIVKDMEVGWKEFGPGEYPPPSALAGRRRVDTDMETGRKKKRNMGLALWSLWGSKHDEDAVEREKKADQQPDTHAVTAKEGQGARQYSDIEAQEPATVPDATSRSRSRRRTVVDEHQTGHSDVDENTPIAKLMEARKKREPSSETFLNVPETGVTGKRPIVDGIAVPFTLKKEADTASMMTLLSGVSPAPGSRPMSPSDSVDKLDANQSMKGEAGLKSERPGLETFVTPDEIPLSKEMDKTEEASAQVA